MSIKSLLIIIILGLGTSLSAQYNPEIDARGTSDDLDGAELQLATPSENHFLRLFSGHNGDVRPYLYFSQSDTFRIANGASNFGGFAERLTISPNGFTGINNRSPEVELQISTFDVDDGSQVEVTNLDRSHFMGIFSGRQNSPSSIIYWRDTDPLLFSSFDGTNFNEHIRITGDGKLGVGTDDPQAPLHVNGAFATSWDATFFHYATGFGPLYQMLPWINKGWNGGLWDYTYVGGSGGRNNNQQAAMIFSHKQGILFGKGHNDGNALSTEHMRIDSVGNVGICNPTPEEKLDVTGNIKTSSLSGVGERNVVADADGVLKIGSPQLKYLSLSGAAFHPSNDNNSISWSAGTSGAYYVTAPADFRSMIAQVSLPHNSTVYQITVHFTDDDSDVGDDARFSFGRFINSSGAFGSLVSITSNTTTGYQGKSITTVQNIDNLSNAYYFSMSPEVAGIMDSDFKIHQVIIEYAE